MGGRAYTINVGGKPVELGGEFVNRDHKTLFTLMNELGVKYDGLTLTEDIFGFNPEEKVSLKKLNLVLRSLIEKLEKSRNNLKNQDYSKWDPTSFKWRYTDLASILELDSKESALLGAFIRDESGIDLEDAPLASISHWIEKLKEYKLLSTIKAAPFIRSALRLYNHQYRIHGGTQALIQSLAHSLPQEQIYLQKELTNLSCSQDSQDTYLLTFKDGTFLKSRNVLMTIPFSVLRFQSGVLDDTSLGISSEFREVID